jgi:hypothetical protein
MVSISRNGGQAGIDQIHHQQLDWSGRGVLRTTHREKLLCRLDFPFHPIITPPFPLQIVLYLQLLVRLIFFLLHVHVGSIAQRSTAALHTD